MGWISTNEFSPPRSPTKSRDQVLKPLLDASLAEMPIPDKPRSSKQRYRLTDKGRQVLEDLKETE